GNSVTVFDKAGRAGGSFRFAGLAPMFQDVEANPASLERYIDGMVAACRARGVTFRMMTNVFDEPDQLAPFDRIVIATGASYRFGLGEPAMAMLDIGAGKWFGLSQLFSDPKLRDWFYYRGRAATGDLFKGLANDRQVVMVIGDAARPGKSKEAIASAFE